MRGLSGSVSGYERHMGKTRTTEALEPPLGDQSASTQTVLGTYIHGLFETQNLPEAYLDTVFERANLERPESVVRDGSPFDRAAELVENANISRSALF